MSLLIVGAVLAVAAVAVAYADRKRLKARALAAEGSVLSEALKAGAALRAKEANVKNAIQLELGKAAYAANAELDTAGVDAKAVLARVAARLHAIL